YFKAHWHPGQYETQPPSVAQLGRIASSLKGAVSLDFMAAGAALAAAAVWAGRRASPGPATPRAAVLCAGLLLAGGGVMYLPMGMMSGRYAMPAVWGLDILFAVLMTALLALPATHLKRAAVGGVCLGLAAVAVANVGRQERVAARAEMLWQAVRHVEATAPPDAAVAWLSGDSTRGGLNVEEGIHFKWHLTHRGRPDIRVGLFDESGAPLPRVELPPLAGEPYFRMGGKPPEKPGGWEAERSFAVGYWLGRKRYECHLGRRPPAVAGVPHDPTRRLSAAAGIGPK
ncbi:MAG TPA: hypothetical protein VMZ71_17180, partial [Gemmataceae bacterium]|nr:hypothetical protein [Gemmataceae bacterium]